jgi:hypothetical protein
MNRAPTLGEIIRSFKAVSTREIRGNYYSRFGWQRNYYEHVIRDDDSLNRVREYIINNPSRWDFDRENPIAQGNDDFAVWLTNFSTGISPLTLPDSSRKIRDFKEEANKVLKV